MKHIGIKLAIVLVAALTAGSALAGPRVDVAGQGQRRAEFIAHFDANKNGVIDAEEKTRLAAARKALLLQKFDANKNGIIDLDERKALQARRAANRLARRVRMTFIRLDADKDGQLALSELPAQGHGARIKARFAVIDTNHDGFIDPAELSAARRK